MRTEDDTSGLKIAVAAFISLSVILAVSCYFLYSAYSMAEARLADAQVELKRAKAAQQTLRDQYNDFRARVATETSAADPAKKTKEPATPR